MHPFTKSGLGQAPFRFLYCASFPAPTLAEHNPEAYNAALRALPREVPLGVCDHCGMTLMHNYVCQSADGHKFVVGCDCVFKVGDNDLSTVIRAAKSKMDKANRVAKIADAGRRIAQEFLAKANLTTAWEIYEGVQARRAAAQARFDEDGDATVTVQISNNEHILCDIVGKLIKYGSISEKQEAFVARLVAQIQTNAPSRKEIWAAERAAETAAAADVPATDERMLIEGEVITLREPDAYAAFPAWKMLVKHPHGFKLWGTRPASLRSVSVGQRVRFEAAVQRSDRDPKFGFFSRPTKGEVL